MIKFLAQLFRGLHFIIGISAPPPGASDRTFVFAWLGGIAFIVVFFMILFFYIIPSLYFRH
jgi:membrane-associated protease RseP (regulator of RpoE activity)